MRVKFWKGIAIGIDLGTANTLISYKGTILLNEPSIIAIDSNSNKLLATGTQAMLMDEKSNKTIRTIKPLSDGVIADFTGAELMIKAFVDQIKIKSENLMFSSFTMLFSVPTGITEVERRAVKDSGINAGASNILMIYEPIASAVGAGLDVMSPEGNLIVEIGGGTTQVALISLSGIVISQSIKTAGNTFNADIRAYIKREYCILIGERTAEAVKIKKGAGLLDFDGEEEGLEIIGRDLLSGIPKAVKIFHSDIASAINKSLIKIEETIVKVLENAPPELAADVGTNGIYISGGGALLKGLKERLQGKLRLKVNLVDEPLNSVIKGASRILNDRVKYASLILN